MKFKVERTSGSYKRQPTPKSVQDGNNWLIELNSLEELVQFIDESNNAIVISLEEDCPCIEIYDDWRE